jgi:hypothetical protein
MVAELADSLSDAIQNSGCFVRSASLFCRGLSATIGKRAGIALAGEQQ